MKRVVFLTVCFFSVLGLALVIAQPPTRVRLDHVAQNGDESAAPASVAEVLQELRAVDPSGRYEAYLRFQARGTDATFESLLGKWAGYALTPATAKSTAERKRFSANLLALVHTKANDSQFDDLVDEAAKAGGATREKVLGIVDTIGQIAIAAKMTRDEVLRVVEGKMLPKAEPARSRFQISAAQRTELRRRGIVGDEAIAEYLPNQARAVPDRQAAHWKARLDSFQSFQRQQAEANATAQMQANALATARDANAQRWATQRQQASAAAAFYAQPLTTGYGAPFYETVQHTGNQTYVNGYGPYGPFNETIQTTGNQTYIYGTGPYGNFNETISNAGNQTWINGYGAFGPFNETIQSAGNQTYINGSGVPPGGFYQPYGYGFGAPYGGYYSGFGGGY